MKNLILIFLLLFFYSAYAQQTIDKLNVNQLKLPKESANKAIIIDGSGQVKSSSTVSDTEIGYLDGLSDTLVNLLGGKEPTITNPNDASKYYRGDKTFQTLDKSAVGLSNVDNTSDANKPISSATQTALNAKADDSVVVKLTGNQSISGTKTFTGKLVASTTANGSIPCPVMTQAQRDLFTAAQGDCVYNSTSLQLNVYDGSVWKSAGGSGGISLWLTATTYAINDVVIESDKIYRALIAHTSGTFATDLSAGKWTEVSASPSTPYSLASGGTNKALTATNGGIVWVDADSFEILAAGVSGQVLQSNGAASPSWVNKSISAKSQNNASVTAEEIQVQNNLLTETSTNKQLIETGNQNILINPSFEHSTFSTGWTNSVGTFTQETSVLVDGKASAKLVLSAQTMSLTQSSTLYQAQFASGLTGIASVSVKSDVALKVCSVQAGVVSSTNCVNVASSNTWGVYSVKFNLGVTSNGISIASTGAVTGTVYIDNAYVGISAPSTEACSSTLSCTDTLSSKISSAGVVSDENVDWINGNCSVVGAGFTCTFNTGIFSVTPNCTVINASGNAGGQSTLDSTVTTSTSLRYTTANATGSASAQPVTLSCQKRGVDYIGRTINAVASDQNLRSPGITKGVVCSFDVSSAGVLSNAIGCSPSVSYSAGNLTLTFSGVWAQRPNCLCTTRDNNGTCSEDSTTEPSTTNFAFFTGTSANALSNTGAFVMCHGVSP